MEDQPHRHDWKIDYSMPTFDSNPIHYGVYCDCGATACHEDGTGRIHDLKEPEINDLSQYISEE